MRVAFIGFILFVWIILAVLITFHSQDAMANSTINVGVGNMTVSRAMDVITSFSVLKWQELFGVIPIPLPNTEYFDVLIKMGTWDFSFFSGNWEYVRWIIFMPITAMLVFGLMVFLLSLIKGAVG